MAHVTPPSERGCVTPGWQGGEELRVAACEARGVEEMVPTRGPVTLQKGMKVDIERARP